ncbi:MAG: hypothetical protein WCP97_09335, partial [bacterium]
MLTVTAPGKIILSGEHAVVYGCPALLSTIDFSVIAKIEHGCAGLVWLVWEDHFDDEVSLAVCLEKVARAKKIYEEFLETGDKGLLKQIVFSKEDFLLLAIGESLLAFGEDSFSGGVSFRLSNTIPLGRGFGSSAAMASTVVGGMQAWRDGVLHKEIVLPVVHRLESYVHGRPSGADAGAVVEGGSIYFQKWKEIEPMPHLLKGFSLPFFIVDAGEPLETTGELVSRVNAFRERDSNAFDQLLGSFSYCVTSLKDALLLDDYHEVVASINRNQELLESIGVVSDDVEA